jgi:cysteine synthase B
MPTPAHIQAEIDRYPTLRCVGNTPLLEVRLFEDELPGVGLYAKLEQFNPGGSVKDRPVTRMLVEAKLAGELDGRVILDSTSGNAGIAYAMVGGILGVPVELVIPSNASNERKRRIKAHGAHIHFTDALLGYDEALREVARRAHGQPERYWFADQYKNANNWRAHYDTTGEEILRQTGGRVTHFVYGVGTGGCITGTARRLKDHDKGIHVTCVIPDAFPGVEGLKPLGSPGDIVPEIFDESVVDQRLQVDVDEAYKMTQLLARRSGVFAGQSSGVFLWGALQVARQIASRGQRGTVVTVFPDLGERYFSTNLWD